MKLVIPAEVPGRLPAPAVKGSFTRDDALEQLLTPFAITWKFVRPGTYTLHLGDRSESPQQPRGVRRFRGDS